MSNDLVRFLRARLDEDERVPRAIAAGARMSGKTTAMRQLVDIESKRRILALVEIWHEPQHKGPNRGHVRSDTYAVAARQELYVVLVQLALPYADHPDYQEAWRP